MKSTQRMTAESDEAAEIAGEKAEKRRDGEGAGSDDDRADKRRPRAVDDAREHVAAEEIGAGDELRRRRLIADEEPLGEWRVGCDARPEDGADDNDRDNDECRRSPQSATRCSWTTVRLRGSPAGRRHDATLPKRMRGSIRVYATSMIRLMSTTKTEKTSVVPWISGMSRFWTASTVSEPRPGSAKVTST